MPRTLAVQTINHIGETVTLKGWANTIRTHGSVNFIDLRDRSGLVQIVGGKELKNIHPEDVIEVTGEIVNRDEKTINPNLKTGTIEIQVKSLNLLNKAQSSPFPLDTDGRDIDEDLRLKYRYLDLRRSRLQHHLRLRSQYVNAMRQYLIDQDFVEIETPMLTKSTPEGSRDFVVPSRLYPGKFYALPQSPQQYKQLLMTAGFEKYFQLARCLRDEDPRADRAYEHTQLDMEMSFVEKEDVISVIEGMVITASEAIGATIAKKPFPIYTYQQALDQFGADKFDLRSDEEKNNNVLSFAWVVDFPFFEKTPEGKWTFTHNPFSSPIKDHEAWLLSKQNIDQIITNQYDLVLNGMEVGGGSIRSHKPEMLQAVFEIMGYSSTEIEAKFGHMLSAFKYGTPPHGGCAHGFERLLMALWNEMSIHEVQAFPQTGRGRTSVMEAPSALSLEQLNELGLAVKSYSNVYDALMEKLKSQNIKYDHYEHEPVFTSEQAAKARGDVSLSQGAKAMLLKVKDKPVLYVLLGDQKMDLKALRRYFDTGQVTLIPLDQIEAVTGGVKPGAIPPFGSLMKLETFVDSRLSQNEHIAFNAGRNDRSVKMAYQDFLKLENPTIVTLE